MPSVIVAGPTYKTTHPNGKCYAPVSTRTTYLIETHSMFTRCLPRPRPYVETNASLAKVVEKKVRDEWVLKRRSVIKFQAARGQGKLNTKRKKRNPNRIDVRVMSPSKWRGFFWHRLLAFIFHNQEGLTRAEFKRKEVDHTNKDFRRIDWRCLKIVDPQGGH